MDMNQVLAAELNVKPWQVEAAVKLIDEETRSFYFTISKRSNRFLKR